MFKVGKLYQVANPSTKSFAFTAQGIDQFGSKVTGAYGYRWDWDKKEVGVSLVFFPLGSVVLLLEEGFFNTDYEFRRNKRPDSNDMLYCLVFFQEEYALVYHEFLKEL